MVDETRLIMGMPVVVKLPDTSATKDQAELVFAHFRQVDERFSTYKETSEITAINKKRLHPSEYSPEMREVFRLSALTKEETNGFFDIRQPNGTIDPSGLVKGWAIQQAAELLVRLGVLNFYVEAGGDISLGGYTEGERPWRVGIRNPFNRQENVKILSLTNCGVATSGTAIRGQHIYDPFHPDHPITDIVSLTVVGPNIYEADRFATAAFAMGKQGIHFIERRPGLEGYMVDASGTATETTGFSTFLATV